MATQKRKRSPLLLIVIIVVTALAAVAAWRNSSFKNHLTDDQVHALLSDPEAAPRDVQHALSQLEERLAPQYPGRERFRDSVVRLASVAPPEIRRQVAWVMGREPAEVYRSTLVRQLEDEDVAVRLNAACSLSNFRDSLARRPLLKGLEPFRILAPVSGTQDLKVDVDQPASSGAALGVVEGSEEPRDIRTPLSGFVQGLPAGKDGAVSAGDPVLLLAPDPKVILNVLVALRTVGKSADVPALKPFAEGTVERMDQEVQDAASATIKAIERRGR